jgi:hypothetical protein
MMRPVRVPERSSVAGVLCWALGCVAALGGCRRQEETFEKPAQPESFSFSSPSGFEPVQLRGEGSERMLAPAGARVERTALGFRVEAGPDFAVEVVPNAAALSELVAPPGVSRVLTEPDLAIFQSPSGSYSFVVVRELVPEWDDAQRHRFACGSAGGVVSEAAPRADNSRFSKAATQAMVAACRTLTLPALE